MWLLHNRTPYAADRTWVQDPDATKRWVVVVKATFTIHADGRLTLADEQLPPLLAPEYHGVDGVSSLRYEADLTLPKPGTDVVLNGHAYAPDGRPTTRVAVALGVGSQRKILRGGVPIELVNLTPGGVLRLTLPKIWLRFRTRFTLRRGERRHEHRAKLHTVVLEPDHPRVLLIWHTSLPCPDHADDLQDTTIEEKPYL